MKRNRTRLLAGLVASLALVATACAGSSDPDAEQATSAEQTDGTEQSDSGDSGSASGSITVSGSSTVEPISSLVAEIFREENPETEITVDGPGTGDGFELFCNGETDISDASRAIKDAEIEACEANGVEYTELKVGIDGIAVMTNPANEQVQCLSFADLYALTGPESEGFGNWSDANSLAEELDGTQAAPYPDASLDIFGPGEESGTYDSYVELVIEGIAEERGQEAQTRKDYSANADDNVIVQGIAGSPSSLGWVGYAFYEENQDQLKALEVAGDDGSCIAPTADTIATGEYPLSRPLFIYVNNAKAQENPALQSFVDFYLSDEGYSVVKEVGYVQLTEDEWSSTQQAWENR